MFQPPLIFFVCGSCSAAWTLKWSWHSSTANRSYKRCTQKMVVYVIDYYGRSFRVTTTTKNIPQNLTFFLFVCKTKSKFWVCLFQNSIKVPCVALIIIQSCLVLSLNKKKKNSDTLSDESSTMWDVQLFIQPSNWAAMGPTPNRNSSSHLWIRIDWLWSVLLNKPWKSWTPIRKTVMQQHSESSALQPQSYDAADVRTGTGWSQSKCRGPTWSEADAQSQSSSKKRSIF